MPKKAVTPTQSGPEGIAHYATQQTPELAAVCNQLRAEIDAALPEATSKIWHGGPVWFMGPNPVVGYDATSAGIKLLFWSGQLFSEPALKPMGSDKAARVLYRSVAEIDVDALRRWLGKSGTIVWDYAGMLAERRKQK
ncbi:MAG: DUF1801 domain-containing protein [Acidobacteria bacterium]|nr:DUF1801 domain-containing protein [Acidobacteriota bacterium]